MAALHETLCAAITYGGKAMYIADLHIHSKYSRATSRDCDLAHLDLWARRKGIGLVGTGDFTHPAWRAELADALVPAEDGLYTLREDLRIPDATAGASFTPRFILTGEISSIYKKGGRVRKVHNLILLPGLEEAETLAQKLEAIGNVHSDGRPILGIDSRDLAEITLDACAQAMLIPAHIWTPHFSLFGAFSGFDRIEDCFEDMTAHIHALETGLSSDPPMNRRVSALDRYTLVSNSDAHSPAKLGREANLISAPLSYPDLKRAIETGEGFDGTIEFFPEEGKYHLDGHRACRQCMTPAQTDAAGGRCPVCGKKITIGVAHRAEDLSDRPEGVMMPDTKPFERLVPLTEVIAASTGVSSAGTRAADCYQRLLRALGPEFYILREAPIEAIEREAGPLVAEGVRRLRRGEVILSPGYDGEYGVVTLLTPAQIEAIRGQLSLFGEAEVQKNVRAKRSRPAKPAPAAPPPEAKAPAAAEVLNDAQLRAAHACSGTVAVSAGPGTGKTKTLVARIAYLIEECGVKPGEITAVTFTNQAAHEMRARLEQRLGGKRAVRALTIGTFHAICMKLLKDAVLIGQMEALDLARETLDALGLKIAPRAFLQAVSRVKNGAALFDADIDEEAFEAYNARLQAAGVLDFDDLLLRALDKGTSGARRFTHLLVDEFQDIDELQYRLVRAWSAQSESLFVIGDADQSIYGFRGADGQAFARLQADIPDLTAIRLTENYRSSPEIISCALSMLSAGDPCGRMLHANRPRFAPVRLVTAADDFSEGIFIAKEIARMTGGVDMLGAQAMSGTRETLRSFSDIAVLCRTNRQAQQIEKCLRHDGIPCVVSGRQNVLEDDAARGALVFFRFLLDARDTPALRLCLRLVWQCPGDLIARAERYFLAGGACTPEALREAFASDAPLRPWIDCAESFLPRVQKEKPRRLLERWAECFPADKDRLEELLDMAVFFSDMPSFLENLLTGEEGDLRRTVGKHYASGAVQVMTLHAAKGLEFAVVFLAGVNDGVIPLTTPRRTDLAEERRLFYVGMTRAREELVLLTSGTPSPFLSAIAPQDLVCESVSRRNRPEAEQLSLF